MTIITDVITYMETSIQATLGATYKKLDYYYTIESNSYKGNVKRYGVIPQEATNTNVLPNVAVTVEHAFQVILTEGFKNLGSSDSDLRNKIQTLLGKGELITTDLSNRIVTWPDYVLSIDLESSDAPEVLEDHNAVALRFNYLVTYNKHY